MIIKVSGDIDSRATSLLESALDEALYAGAHRIDVDVEDMTSCCSSAFQILLSAPAQARQSHLLLRVIDADGPWACGPAQAAAIRPDYAEPAVPQSKPAARLGQSAHVKVKAGHRI
ncbi:STAS domain-containing protein [Streptomyces xanthochromogenes]|uniref:STAS domain-containing protein n=1 Tax=Streptomyces xanthochromogenes TaxID=67384 RepID=UPI00341ECC22